MTQEDKDLLLKDLCARLPYGVIVEIEDEPQTPVQFEWQHLNFIINWEWTIKPYLRPMSSMTWEEYREYRYLYLPLPNKNEYEELWKKQDWLNSHHFDYRDLISKGLALEAPEGMYKIKEK